ncbi:tyrosine-type recombinase/integrase [Paenirhodobacter sp. CAU 1674]|uniref:tyrosine-type recombinase/integrase n=1 Tax=Paenirhodobacter sp. CAU 1674 TaxID=3032596 RepID=UPI0023DB048E|nr:tyrosine-type recombinase/integrase [Paenirhodobacter sp. CAU 1674]MDF2140816.1 tyrosine-type recombinase/integrase [Paenirhodobacter sp. CAU 1674]
MVRKPGRKPYVRETKPGCVYFYRGGKYLHRFTAPEGTAEFDRQYWEVMTGKTQEAKRSWAAAIKILRTSDRWAEHSQRYRQDLEPVLEYLEDKIGKRDVRRLTAADIYAAMDANKHRVRFANYIPVAVSMIAKEVLRLRWLTDNPAVGIERLKVPKAKQQPHVPWPDAAIEKFRAEAGQLERLIFEIGVGTVQRPGDWVGFQWGDYDGDSLTLRQNKTDKPLVLPCTAALKRALDAAKAALPYAPMPNRFIIGKQDGSAMTYRRLAEVMLGERQRLGLEAYDLHALRYRGVMELAWAGCDDDEIMSYSGHSTKKMVVKYAGEARQIMRARQAREKRK